MYLIQLKKSLKCFTIKTSLEDYYSWSPPVNMLLSKMSPLFLCLCYKTLTPTLRIQKQEDHKCSKSAWAVQTLSQQQKARRATANFLQQGLLPHFILKIFHGILTVIVESVQELGDSNHCSYLKTRYIYIDSYHPAKFQKEFRW